MTESMVGVKRKVTTVDVIQDRSGLKKKKSAPVPLECNLPIEVIICEGSIVMMTSNINVEDGLVNGVIGTVIRIIEGNKPLGQPQAVYVRFHNDRVGLNVRAVSRPPVEIDKVFSFGSSTEFY